MASLAEKVPREKSSSLLKKIITVVVISLTTLFLFEASYRLILRFAPDLLTVKARGLDYGDTWRPEGFGPGGSLKQNFEAMVAAVVRRPVPHASSFK